MSKNYLLNLYKNLNLYNNKNLDNFVKDNKNNLNILFGGGAPDHYQKVFLDLFRNIKSDLESMKSSGQINTNEVEVKLRTFKVFTDLYQYYITLLTQEHMIADKKITEIDTIAKDPKITQAQTIINDISQQFRDLL